ncbi:transporter associated domain-containing protein [Sinorhizobium medicae]|nr:transporter associated domain-containing protein [Sinorhizobium medicae]
MPEVGERVMAGDLVFEVLSIEGRNIDKVRISRNAHAEMDMS